MEKRYQVFVSSTYTDLIEERKEVTQAILKCNCFPAGMELFPASNKNQWAIIKRVIDDSDFYLLILAGRYGSMGVDDNGKKVGYTEMEFNYALEQKKPILVFLHQNPEDLPHRLTEASAAKKQKLEKFREKAATGRMVRFWNNKDQLHSAVLESLHSSMEDPSDLIGWVRADAISHTEHNKKDAYALDSICEIDDDEELLNFLEEQDSSRNDELFGDITFIRRFSGILMSQSAEIIFKACTFIPSYFQRADKYNQTSKIFISKVTSFINKKLESCDTQDELMYAAVKLAKKFSIFSPEILLATNKLYFSSDNEKHRSICSEYMHACEDKMYFRYRTAQKYIYQSCVAELGREKSVFPQDELCEFMSMIVKTESDFERFYDYLLTQSAELQHALIEPFIQYVGGDVEIISPKLQRKFWQLLELVLSWNDDLTAYFLSYCLFTRTNDIFTHDEIFEIVSRTEDDVFQLFFWTLPYAEYDYTGELYYTLDDDERERIIDIIKARNHPRGNKLLQRY